MFISIFGFGACHAYFGNAGALALLAVFHVVEVAAAMGSKILARHRYIVVTGTSTRYALDTFAHRRHQFFSCIHIPAETVILLRMLPLPNQTYFVSPLALRIELPMYSLNRGDIWSIPARIASETFPGDRTL